MNLETIFEKFDLFADAPNAVEKTRDLIRTLAVQGELVPQDRNDEPAEVLINRVAAGLSKKQSENPFLVGIEPSIINESMYDLPSGWAWLPLGHAGIWATGCGFPKQFQGVTGGEFLFCKVSDMNLPGNEAEIHTTVNSIDADVMQKIRARANPVGTVIFPKIGGAIATHKRRLVIKPTIIDNNCSGIQPIGLTDNKWLLMLMRSIDLTRYQTGTSVPALSQGALDPIRIGLPPLAEQKRIVAKVDELMAVCDRLEQQQQERETRHAVLARASLARFADAPTPANLDFIFHKSYDIAPSDLRNSILTLAVHGKLVPQDPNDEPASNLITRAQAERKELIGAGIIKRVKELDEKSIVDEMMEIPDNWASCSLDEIALKITDGEHATPVRENQGYYLLSARNVRDGFIDVSDVDYVGKDEFERIRKRCDPDAGDILLSCSGSVGRVAVVDADNKYAMVRSAALIKHSKTNVDSHYLSLTLRSPSLQRQIERSSKQSAQANLFIEPIRRLVVPIPPLAEQRRIVARVDELMALVDALETQLATARTTAEKLMDAVVVELTGKDTSRARETS